MTNTKEIVTVDLSKIQMEYNDKQYNVVLFNDDVTPIDYVIFVMLTVFNKNERDAVLITVSAQEEGKCIVTTYDSFDDANSRVEAVNALNAEYGLTLKTEVEEVD